MASMSGWRITRAGSIFIVITLVLTGLVIGGTYFVRERGEQVRQQEAAEIARQNLEAASDSPVVLARDEPEEVAGEQTPGTNQPAPSELPETGPASGALIGAALLTFFVVGYVNSRRAILVAGIRR